MCYQETTLEAAFTSYYGANLSLCVTTGRELRKIKDIWTLKSHPYFYALIFITPLFSSAAVFLSECSIFVVLLKGLSILHGGKHFDWYKDCNPSQPPAGGWKSVGGRTVGGLLSKTRAVFKKHLSPDHPSVSIYVQIFTSFLPLTFDPPVFFL